MTHEDSQDLTMIMNSISIIILVVWVFLISVKRK